VGADWKFARYFVISADYRISKRLFGVNTDGFSLGLRLFD
jgi:hypothetical protein